MHHLYYVIVVLGVMIQMAQHVGSSNYIDAKRIIYLSGIVTNNSHLAKNHLALSENNM